MLLTASDTTETNATMHLQSLAFMQKQVNNIKNDMRCQSFLITKFHIAGTTRSNLTNTVSETNSLWMGEVRNVVLKVYKRYAKVPHH